ncbi:thiamine phosphate synthase [Phaeobacter marinintestinus]|uniref:thiamine phosphate synthase n=1 Tax=Falsiphaeobacter marinintestinus TaxID=1492905 RepID=UPI0011B585F0|nr:thiamine phosphate synthase [Phaeobacter marinintestinus]
MDAPEQPQLYLITPPVFDADAFAPVLANVLDGLPIACIRLAMASTDEDTVARAADALRAVAHARDIAIVVNDHVLLAERLGLDGVHLSDAGKSVRAARKTLGADAIVGSFCGVSSHDGLSAGEAGADYISFGPVSGSGLGDGSVADTELFQWWSDVVELPVVAEGGLTPDLVAQLAPMTDFFGIGDEIWSADDPLSALKTLIAPLD